MLRVVGLGVLLFAALCLAIAFWPVTLVVCGVIFCIAIVKELRS